MASKDSKSLLIWHSIFVLLSVGLGVAWYFTWDHTSDLEKQLEVATMAEAGSKGEIQNLQTEVGSLKELIGRAGTTDEVVRGARTEITRLAGDASSSTIALESAVVKNAIDRDLQGYAVSERTIQLAVKTAELESVVRSNDNAAKSLKDALDEKVRELGEKERLHGEQLAQRTKQFDEISTQLLDVQSRFSTARDSFDNEKRDLEDERDRQSKSLRTLRSDKIKAEDLKFERPDGSLLFVDQDAALCTIDLGIRDDLMVGTTFSVYAKANSGVGRRQSDDDIKGKIEVVELLDSHLAKVRIVDQKLGDPLAAGGPIYSPLFWPGQKLQIAVVGMLDFDGNPGSDRAEFNRIVKNSGAEIVLQINDQGGVEGRDGEDLSPSDIDRTLTSAVRFLVIGNLGDEETADTAQNAIYNTIRARKEEMREAAESNGVYVLELASFLEYVGYTSKRLVFTPTKEYPGVLPNGAKSLSVNGSLGRRESSGTTSGTFSKRRRKPLVSTGSTTKLYSTPSTDE